jgi:hypothetical protein
MGKAANKGPVVGKAVNDTVQHSHYSLLWKKHQILFIQGEKRTVIEKENVTGGKTPLLSIQGVPVCMCLKAGDKWGMLHT